MADILVLLGDTAFEDSFGRYEFARDVFIGGRELDDFGGVAVDF